MASLYVSTFSEKVYQLITDITAPRDGWFHTSFSTFLLGAGAGYAFQKYSLNFNGGWQRENNPLGIFNHGDLAILSFFVNLGLSYHW